MRHTLTERFVLSLFLIIFYSFDMGGGIAPPFIFLIYMLSDSLQYYLKSLPLARGKSDVDNIGVCVSWRGRRGTDLNGLKRTYDGASLAQVSVSTPP